MDNKPISPPLPILFLKNQVKNIKWEIENKK